jgi:NTE family protein
MLPNLTSQKVAIPAALFLALSPGLLLTTDGSKVFHEPKNQVKWPYSSTLSCSSLCTVSSPRLWVSCSPNDLIVTTALFLGCSAPVFSSLSLPDPVGSSVWSDQPECGSRSLDRVRDRVCAFTSPISSVLLSRKMKYLVLGPASMGIFSLIGALKARETNLVNVKEISGSSAGAILALFLAVGMSVDEILETSLSLNIPNFVKIRIGSFFNKFGFVDMGPIRKKFVEICGSDPTFEEIDMKIYIAAFCMNTSETVYFSKDTHPDMKVIDAVCMSMAVPFIFACGKYNGETYVDGGMKEEYPLTPFFDKKPHEVTCIKIKMNRIYQEDIQTPKEFVDCLVRSALSNRVQYNTPIKLIEIDVGDTDIFNFSMSYEEKLQLFNRGYTFLSA